MAKYVVVNGDDWEGLYKDGELVVESHHLKAKEILDRLDEKIDIEFRSADLDWMYEVGSFPEKISDVKFGEL